MKILTSYQTGAVQWFARNQNAVMRLVCFSCAGGTASFFRDWAGLLPNTVELCGIELPGHGFRRGESLINNFEVLKESLVVDLVPFLEKPAVFFGHSMGGLICFEIARRVRTMGFNEPLHLFVSSSPAPQVVWRRERLSVLSEQALLDRLVSLNGIPREVLKSDDFMRMFIPVVRADFSLIDSYRYREGCRLDCPISVFGGESDSSVVFQELEAWREQTADSFSLQMFPGDHFFLRSSSHNAVRLLSSRLKSLAQLLNVGR